MACGKGKVQLSPSDQKIGKAIEHDYLTIEQIADKTGFALFKVRSGIRKLKQENIICEKDEMYKLKEK